LRSGSREVVISLIVEEPLLLTTEALSKGSREADIGMRTEDVVEVVDVVDVADVADVADITEDATDRMLLKCMSFAKELETGRFSGKSAFTMVIKSEGPSTRYGWTSAVSRKEVMDLAGKSLAFDLDGRVERNRAIIFSIWALIARGVDGDLFLVWMSVVTSNEMVQSKELPCHIHHQSLRSHRNLFENLLSPIFGNMVF